MTPVDTRILDSANVTLSVATSERLSRTRAAWRASGLLPDAVRVGALHAIADSVQQHSESILRANRRDLDKAKVDGLATSKTLRLILDESKIAGIVQAIRDIANQPDPLDRSFPAVTRPSGLRVTQRAVPIGVIGVIFEARPNVTTDAAALCLRGGNGVVLRPGSDCWQSSTALMQAIHAGLDTVGLCRDLVLMLPDSSRESVRVMLHANDTLDLIIPRGGSSLVEFVRREARMPVLSHAHGLCHLYIDAHADPQMAHRLTINAKLRRVEICGALETLLIHESIAAALLPGLLSDLHDQDCEIRGDEIVSTLANTVPIIPASTGDWDTEYLDRVISVKIVSSAREAIDHINTHGSGHTDAICTNNADVAQSFLRDVDSAIVMHNVSTQFADGGEFGLGGEIGIATGRLHARGPVGANELTIAKYVVSGEGLCRP